jgi:hypothetical protein
MGGLGSGGSNRVRVDLHKCRGTYRPSRHTMGELVRLLTGLPANAPDMPEALDEAGRDLWRLLWTGAP